MKQKYDRFSIFGNKIKLDLKTNHHILRLNVHTLEQMVLEYSYIQRVGVNTFSKSVHPLPYWIFATRGSAPGRVSPNLAWREPNLGARAEAGLAADDRCSLYNMYSIICLSNATTHLILFTLYLQ